MLDSVFSPFSLKGKTFKNRLIVPAMVTNYCTEEGYATERYIAYHEEKAKGGFGLIITEDYAVSKNGRSYSHVGGIFTDEHMKGHTELVKRVHNAGALIFAQIFHCGRQGNMATLGEKPVAPSPIPCPFSPDVPRELTIPEIEQIVEDFGTGALRAKKCGFDGVELHGGHGYLISQFLSPFANKRTDEYGGNLINRLRFPLAVIKKVRETCGEDFIIDFRISADEFVPSGRTIEDTKTIVPYLVEAGIDMIHVSAGLNAAAFAVIPPSYMRHGWIVDFAKEVKEIVDIPVITVGRINDPVLADQVIASGKADFVAMGRASLVDPGMPNKAKAGKFEDIRYCIGCDNGCLGYLAMDQPIKCVLNPTLGREYEGEINKAVTPKTVAVVGAGPAGLSAAITAAHAGHSVTVYEKMAHAGGQFYVASFPPAKGEITEFIGWQLTQAKKLGIKINFNTSATVELFKKEPADVIIAATGSTAIIPPIKGIDRANVVPAAKVLTGEFEGVGMTVVVIGGGQVGAETANFIAIDLRRSVTIVEMLGAIAADENIICRGCLLQSLHDNFVGMYTDTKVLEITDASIKAVRCGQEIEIPADTIVIAAGSKSDASLSDELQAAGFNIQTIGDANEVAQVLEAVASGFEAGKAI